MFYCRQYSYWKMTCTSCLNYESVWNTSIHPFIHEYWIPVNHSRTYKATCTCTCCSIFLSLPGWLSVTVLRLSEILPNYRSNLIPSELISIHAVLNIGISLICSQNASGFLSNIRLQMTSQIFNVLLWTIFLLNNDL